MQTPFFANLIKKVSLNKEKGVPFRLFFMCYTCEQSLSSNFLKILLFHNNLLMETLLILYLFNFSAHPIHSYPFRSKVNLLTECRSALHESDLVATFLT